MKYISNQNRKQLMKSKKTIPYIVASVILWFFFGILGMSIVYDLFIKPPSLLWPTTSTKHQSSVSASWEQQNFYIYQSNHTQLIAANGKVLLIGSETPNSPYRLIALDENSGNIMWRYGGGNTYKVTLATSDSMVFVSESGGVTALNLDDGNVLWSTQLPSANTVTKLLIQNNVLYADTVGPNYFLLDVETGKVLQSISYVVNNTWNVDLPKWSNHLMDLVFSGNIGYFQKQTGSVPNGDEVEIIAMDELNGNQLWSSKVPAISRITTNSSGAYVLTLNGKLLKLDSADGFPNDLIQFTPAPILHSSSENENVGYGYYAAVDTDNQMIFVYLGDSAQLFAYKLSTIQ
jgi:hypothetical protein